MHNKLSRLSCSGFYYKKDSDSRESTESQLCNPMYLTPAWLPLESCEYPYTSWCAAKKILIIVS